MSSNTYYCYTSLAARLEETPPNAFVLSRPNSPEVDELFLEHPSAFLEPVDPPISPRNVVGIPPSPSVGAGHGLRPDLHGPVQRFRRKIRDIDAYIVWYLSTGIGHISYPSQSSADPGDLYLHREKGGNTQIWLRTLDLQWKPTNAGDSHPCLTGYRLHMLFSGEPRWVTKKTVTTYRGREKRQTSVVSPITSFHVFVL